MCRNEKMRLEQQVIATRQKQLNSKIVTRAFYCSMEIDYKLCFNDLCRPDWKQHVFESQRWKHMSKDKFLQLPTKNIRKSFFFLDCECRTPGELSLIVIVEEDVDNGHLLVTFVIPVGTHRLTRLAGSCCKENNALNANWDVKYMQTALCLWNIAALKFTQKLFTFVQVIFNLPVKKKILL